MAKKAVFRVDSGAHIGLGHIFRCKVLADQLRSDGFEITFLLREHLNCHIPSEFHSILIGSGRVSKTLDIDYSNWLGVTEAQDAEDSITHLKEIEEIDYLIIDNYGLGLSYEQIVRPHVNKIIVIDDLMNREHDCDILIDQNPSADTNIWKNLTPNDCKLLLGLDYCIISNNFSKSREVNDGFNLKNVLLFLGSAPAESYLPILHALNQVELIQDSQITCILKNWEENNSLVSIDKSFSNIQFLNEVKDMHVLLKKTDFAIGAGGTSQWERSCLGVPSIITSIASNQEVVAEKAHEKGICHYIGKSNELTTDDWLQTLNHELPQKEKWLKIRKNGTNQINGQGKAKISEVLL